MMKGISEIEYLTKGNSFFKNKKGILLRDYDNFSGFTIKRDAIIIILEKMQRIQEEEILHPNLFYVREINTGIEIGGIRSRDIHLLDI